MPDSTDSNGGDKKPAKRTLDLSPEERQRRRDNLARLRAEGKIGPEFGKLGGRPRKKRASEIIAEEAEKDARKILQVLKDGIDDSQSMSTRLQSAKQYLEIEKDERRLQIDEEDHIEKMDRSALAELVAKKLDANPMVREAFLRQLAEEEEVAGVEEDEDAIPTTATPA